MSKDANVVERAIVVLKRLNDVTCQVKIKEKEMLIIHYDLLKLGTYSNGFIL